MLVDLVCRIDEAMSLMVELTNGLGGIVEIMLTGEW